MHNNTTDEWWFPVSGDVIKSDKLTGGEKLLWLVLCAYRNSSTGEAFPAMLTLCRQTGMGRARLRRGISGLVKKGLVEAILQREGSFNRGYVFRVKLPNDSKLLEPQKPNETAEWGNLIQTSKRGNPIPIPNKSIITRQRVTRQNNEGSPAGEQDRFEGKILSPDEILEACEAGGVCESIAEGWAEEVRLTGRLSGRLPTPAFVEGRIRAFTAYRENG